MLLPPSTTTNLPPGGTQNRREDPLMQTVEIWGFLLVPVGAWLGALLGPYLKKKGENLATHEDLQKLVTQVEAVTTATKQIETKISNEVWDRQKRWEVKRDVLFEAIRRTSEIDNALRKIKAMLQVEAENPLKEDDSLGQLARAQSRNDVTNKWLSASTEFEETKLLVAVVCENETREAFDVLGAYVNIIAAEMTTKGEAEIYDRMYGEVSRKILGVRAAVRKELGVDKVETEKGPPEKSGEPRLNS